MTEHTLKAEDLNKFSGTETYYRHGINRKAFFTDGVKYVADTGGAYWLIDEILLIQQHHPRLAAEEFQLWRLQVFKDRKAILDCDDGDGHIIYAKDLEFTDFPLDEIKLYFENEVLMLPSER
jgi:hypothetical protein